MQIQYEMQMPRVVGEFDAEGLHRRIDAICRDNPAIWSGQLLLALGEGKPKLISEIAGVRYHKKFNSDMYDNCHLDGQTDELLYVSGHNPTFVDKWHMDTVDDIGGLRSPSILTGASIWPTAFLVGRVGLSLADLKAMTADMHDFFGTEQGTDAINRAIVRGDARVEKLAAGEIAVAGSGIIHKRSVPEVHAGYRYFIRRFPRSPLVHSRPVMSHLKIARR